jgi:RNA polymerase sigma-70 factor (ECF subfamily)
MFQARDLHARGVKFFRSLVHWEWRLVFGSYRRLDGGPERMLLRVVGMREDRPSKTGQYRFDRYTGRWMKTGAEGDLISRCRKGEARAWDELFDLHYAAAGRFVYQLGSDFSREDVEEICQETFLSVIRNLESFNGNSQLQTWLFRIAANKARDYRERQRAAKRGGGQTPVSLQAEDPENGLTLDPPSNTPGPDARIMDAERMALLGESLDRLGGPCREIIELRYFGDLSYDEIGNTLELNVKTVSSRLSKCLDRLEEIARPVFSRENTPRFSV